VTGYDNPDFRYFRALQLQFNGRMEEAEEEMERCLRMGPTFGRASLSLARIRRQTPESNHVGFIRSRLASVAPGSEDHAAFEFALHKELDDLGQLDDAWAALDRGNAVMAARMPYDAAAEERLFDRIIECFDADFLARPGETFHGPMPIFVVGMPRSGTTLLERILGNHPQIETCGELNDFRQQMQWANNRRTTLTLDAEVGAFVAQLDANLLGYRFLAKTKWLTKGKSLYSDKHPLNMLWCGPILKALPHAKIIHLRRNPMDSCFSNLKELFAPEYYPYSYALDELAAHYRNYNRLMQHWHAIAPGSILDVRYEDLVMHPEHEARRVQEYLGLPAVEGVTDILANRKVTTTASTLQLRQPIHTRNIAGWKRYARGLAPLEVQLRDLIDAYEGRAAAAA
jgi:Sulfotransferase family